MPAVGFFLAFDAIMQCQQKIECWEVGYQYEKQKTYYDHHLLINLQILSFFYFFFCTYMSSNYFTQAPTYLNSFKVYQALLYKSFLFYPFNQKTLLKK